MYKESSAASVDSFVFQYQNLMMKPSEKLIQYVNLIKNLENRLTAIGHAVGDVEKKIFLLRGLRFDYAVIAGVVRAMYKSLQDANGLLDIQEAEEAVADRNSVVKPLQAFTVKHYDRDPECYFCVRKHHIKINCFNNSKSKQYKGDNDDINSGKDDVSGSKSLTTFITGVDRNYAEVSDKLFVDSGTSAPI